MDLLIAANTVTQPNSDIAPATGTPGWATDGDPTTNTQATQAPAWHYNMMMAEMLAIVKAAGITPSNADWSQVLKAMQTIFAPAQRGVAPYSATLAQLIGGYPKYAVVVDAAGAFWVSQCDENMTVPGADGANWKSLFDGSVTQEWVNKNFQKAGDYATNAALSNGLATRQQAGSCVEKTGDTMTGPLLSSGWLSGGVGGGMSGSATPGSYMYSNGGVGFGDPHGDGSFKGTWGISDIYDNGTADNAGINLTGYDAAKKVFQWYLAWNGNIITPKGKVAFESDFSANLAQNGYQKLASGLIVQWGFLTVNGSGEYDLPIEFPNNFFIVQAADVGSGLLSYGAYPASKSTFHLYTNHSGQVNCSFFAIGN